MKKTKTPITKKKHIIGLIAVKNANPNGDPLSENMPRVSDGIGIIEGVCIKKKIRNVWVDDNLEVLLQSTDRNNDGYKTLQQRFEKCTKDIVWDTKNKKTEEKAKRLLETYPDVRAFGAVVTLPGTSLGITGAVTGFKAESINKIDIESSQITKSLNTQDSEVDKKSSDTMGMKHEVKFGLYRFDASVSVLQSKKNGFTEEDFDLLINAITRMFDEDASCARPAGSMWVEKLWVLEGTNVNPRELKNMVTVKQVSLPAKEVGDFEILMGTNDKVCVTEIL